MPAPGEQPRKDASGHKGIVEIKGDVSASGWVSCQHRGHPEAGEVTVRTNEIYYCTYQDKQDLLFYTTQMILVDHLSSEKGWKQKSIFFFLR